LKAIAKAKIGKQRENVAEKRFPNRNWLAQTIPEDMTIPEAYELAARVLVDPGHSADDLRTAGPLPNRNFGASVFTLPSIQTVNVTVSAGETMLLATTCDPAIAFVSWYKTTQGIPALAYSTQVAKSQYPAQYGAFMQQSGYKGVRCTAKSITAENITPQLSRGGMTYSRRINTLNVTTNPYLMIGTGISGAGNQGVRYIGEYPADVDKFMASGVYNTHDSDGCYVVCAPVRSTYDTFDVFSKEVNKALCANQPTDSVLAGVTRLMFGGTNIADSAMLLSWGDMPTVVGKSEEVFSTGLHDGMSTEVIALSAPASADQTFSIKFHARYEFILDEGSKDFVKSVKVEADAEALDDILHYASLLPGAYPVSYNSLGSVWRAFKKGLAWVGKTIGLPLLRTAAAAAAPAVKAKFVSKVNEVLSK
jgi:hypothetical protein